MTRSPEKLLARMAPVLLGLILLLFFLKPSSSELPDDAQDSEDGPNLTSKAGSFLKRSQWHAYAIDQQQYQKPPRNPNQRIDMQQQTSRDAQDARELAAMARGAPIPARPYAMVMCTRIWNEARYLDEWITYHYILGFDHFMLDDHGSTDNTSVVLKPYIDAGLVTLTYTASNTTIVDSERSAREHCYDGSVIPNRDMGWVAQIDLDEQLVLSQARVKASSFRPTAAQELFKEYERRKEAVVQITRLHLGTNDNTAPPAWPLGQADAFTERKFLDYPGNFWPKVMCRAGKWKPVPQGEHATQHCALGIDGWTRVTANHQVVPERNPTLISEWDYINVWPVVFDPLHIVHFQTRSLEECLGKNRHPKMGGSWRAIAGEDQICNSWHPSHQSYQPWLFSPHLTLKNSLYNRATRHILRTGGLFARST